MQLQVSFSRELDGHGRNSGCAEEACRAVPLPSHKHLHIIICNMATEPEAQGCSKKGGGQAMQKF